MSHDANRPSYAPENRSANAGKFIAIGVFVLLLLASAVSLYVVVNRGSAGIVLRHDPRNQPQPAQPEVPAPQPAAPVTPPTQ